MSTWKKVLLAAAIVLVGICAALPFRREAEEWDDRASEPASAIGQTALREIPLKPSSLERSPATALYESTPAGEPPAPARAAATLEHPAAIEAPPSLAGRFEPLLPPIEAARAPGWGRIPAGRPAEGQIRQESDEPVAPRKHRLVDGDSLESLARRYLGDARRKEEIYQANRAVLVSPDVLPLGVEIAIPPRLDSPRENVPALSPVP